MVRFLTRGVTHNIPLLRDVLTEPVFLSGTFTTSYLPQTYPDGFQGVKMEKGENVFFDKLIVFSISLLFKNITHFVIDYYC